HGSNTGAPVEDRILIWSGARFRLLECSAGDGTDAPNAGDLIVFVQYRCGDRSVGVCFDSVPDRDLPCSLTMEGAGAGRGLVIDHVPGILLVRPARFSFVASAETSLIWTTISRLPQVPDSNRAPTAGRTKKEARPRGWAIITAVRHR